MLRRLPTFTTPGLQEVAAGAALGAADELAVRSADTWTAVGDAAALVVGQAEREPTRCDSAVFGDTLQITTTHPFVHDSAKVALPTQGMLCIADFWLTGDGDQALFDLRDGAVDDPPVLYYDHDQPAVRPVAASFTTWIEKLPQALAE